MNPTSTLGFSGGHALVIAVAAYPKVNQLPAAVIHDGHAMVATLSSPVHCGYLPQNVTLLLDREATLHAIRRELAALASRTKPEDTVVIFFSGHGARLGAASAEESALVPFDCVPQNLAATTLSEADFSAALAAIRAQRLVVLIDACHSAGAGSFKAAEIFGLNLGFTEKSLSRLANGTGRVLIASSRASETSLVIAGASNSLFTEHLVAALRGACLHSDGLIRIFDVFSYVAQKVRGAAPGRQHPVFKANDVEDNFPLALYCGGQKTSVSTSREVVLSDAGQQLERVLADLYPTGPQEQDIWARAGGDLSRLRLSGTGRASWFSALRTLSQGGGGSISRKTLVQAALEEFPHHPDLQLLSQ